MTRRTLLKVLAFLPVIGPTVAKALVKMDIQSAPAYGPYLPKHFPKWDRAVDGLEEAGKWAIGIERSRLPLTMIVPRVGEVWETVRDCDVDFRPLASGLLPFGMMLGGKARLQQGELIRILGLDHPDKPLRVCFRPVRYHELHAAIVPEEIRLKPGYEGYELSIKTAKTIADFGKDAPKHFFNEAFRLIEGAA